MGVRCQGGGIHAGQALDSWCDTEVCVKSVYGGVEQIAPIGTTIEFVAGKGGVRYVEQFAQGGYRRFEAVGGNVGFRLEDVGDSLKTIGSSVQRGVELAKRLYTASESVMYPILCA